MNYEVDYKNYLKKELEKLTDHPIEIYNELEWQQGTNIDSDTICIVLQRLPSMAYGDTIIQQLNVIVEVEQRLQNDVMDMLNKYQKEKYNMKTFMGDSLITETYQTPMVTRPFDEMNVNYGMEITMGGTVTISKNASDIKSIKINKEEVTFIEVRENLTCDTPAQPFVNSPQLIEATTKTTSYNISIRILNTSKNVCKRLRNYMHGEGNDTSTIKLTYTDDDVFEKQFIYSSISVVYSNGALSIYDVSYVPKKVNNNG